MSSCLPKVMFLFMVGSTSYNRLVMGKTAIKGVKL